jgi:hypothetical protein
MNVIISFFDILSLLLRAATQSYMKNEKRRQETLLKENVAKKKHYPSRQSVHAQSASNQQGGKQQMPTALSSINTSDDEERLFHVKENGNIIYCDLNLPKNSRSKRVLPRCEHHRLAQLILIPNKYLYN